MTEIERLNERIAHLEDQLETARIQVETARVEAEKADDEAIHWKAECLRIRSKDDFDSYKAIKRWQRRVEKAEAALATLQSTGGEE